MGNNYNDLPRNLRPISPWKYFGLSILYGLPIVGIVFLIIHSISPANINRRNYARSYFCILALVLIIVVVTIIIQVATTGSAMLIDYLKGHLGI